MAFLKKRNKIYHIYYRNEVGQQVSRTTKTSDFNKAKQELKKFNAKHELGLLPSEFEPYHTINRLSDAYNLFLTNRNLVPKTKALYDLSVKHFIKACGDKAITMYNSKDYLLFIKYLNEYKYTKKKDPIAEDFKTISINAKATYLRYMKALFEWFKRNEMVEKNIIRTIKTEHKDVVAINKKDLQDIIDALSKTKIEFEIKFLLYTGMRVNEALSLTWNSIDFQNKQILIRNTKVHRVEKIPIINKVLELLNQRDKSKPIFSINYFYLRDNWRDLMKGLSLKYNLHQLRKTCGTMMANKGVTALYLQNYLRHTNFNITLKYYIQPDLKKMRNEIDEKDIF